jgi:hypothetical protein
LIPAGWDAPLFEQRARTAPGERQQVHRWRRAQFDGEGLARFRLELDGREFHDHGGGVIHRCIGDAQGQPSRACRFTFATAAATDEEQGAGGQQ